MLLEDKYLLNEDEFSDNLEFRFQADKKKLIEFLKDSIKKHRQASKMGSKVVALKIDERANAYETVLKFIQNGYKVKE